MVALLLPSLTGVAHAENLFVAPDGSAEFLSISDALDAAATGDTIVIAPGSYAPSTGERLPFYLPTGIALQGAGAGLTIIDADGEERFAEVYNDGAALGGITWTGASGPAASIAGSLAIDACAFVGNESTAVYLDDGSTISDTTFEDNESAVRANGDVRVGGVRVVARSDSITPEVQIEGEEGEVDGLTVIGGGGVRLAGASSNVAVLGATSATADGCLHVQDGWLQNSTVVGCGSQIAAQAEHARNNLIAHNTGAGLDADYAVNNLLYANAGGDFSGTDWTDQLSNLTNVDPLFRDFSDDGDWTNDDLRLSEGSPAIDAAAADFPATDIEGTPRPQDGDGDGRARADIGAYEWGQLDADGDG